LSLYVNRFSGKNPQKAVKYQAQFLRQIHGKKIINDFNDLQNCHQANFCWRQL